MKTYLLFAALLLTATLAPLAAADVTVQQCGPDVGCAWSDTYQAPGPSCTITLPAEVSRHGELVQC